jgi:hypothetical protein
MWKHGGGKKGANFVEENRIQTEKGWMDGIHTGIKPGSTFQMSENGAIPLLYYPS